MFLASFRRKPFFRPAAWLALWLLLFPALVPLVHHPLMAAAAPSMPICHMAGMDGQAGKSDAGKAQAPCPICQSLDMLAHGFVTPPEIAVVAPVFAHDRVAAVFETAPVSENLLSPWPRGPPVLA